MTAQDIFRWIGDARRGNREYFSNAYYTVTQLEAFLAEKDVRVVESDDLILLIEKDDGLYRLQFCARNASALEKLPSLLPKLDAPLVADLVGREPAVSLQEEQLSRFGFEPYSVFVRMVNRERVLPREDGMDRVVFAEAADAEKALSLIANTFDPLFSHIPLLSEIEEAIEKREITVVRNGNDLCGLAFFQKESDTYYVLRFFVVDPAYRGQNVAGALMRQRFVTAPDGCIYMLWVGTYNPAQQLYQKFGFKYDGLTDRVMKYKTEN